MPTIDFSQLPALTISDLTFSESAGAAAQNGSDGVFNDYLARVNTFAKPAEEDTSADDVRTMSNREVGCPPPSRADAAPRSAEHGGATPQPSASHDSGLSADAPARPADPNRDEAGVAPSRQPDQAKEEQTSVTDAKQNAPKDGESQPSDKNSVKDKKKSKEEIDDSKGTAGAAVQKNPVELAATLAAPALPGPAEKQAPSAKDAIGSGAAAEAAVASPVSGDPTAKQGKYPLTKADPAAAAAARSTPVLQQPAEIAANQAVAGDRADATGDAAGDGSPKAKYTLESVSEATNGARKYKLMAEGPPEASLPKVADTSSTPVANGASDAVAAVSVAPQASAGIMQSVLEVLKNTQKTTQTSDSVGAIGDGRANLAARSSAAAPAGDAGSASAATASDNSSYAARAQFVQRVEQAFAAMGNREGSVRLKLSPPELGVLKLEIGVKNGAMKAHVEAETTAAKTLLLDHLPELRERLARQNIHIQQFDVDLMDRSPGGTPQQTFGQTDSGTQQNNRSLQRANDNDNALAGAAAASSPQLVGMGGSLNVIV